MTAIIKEQFRHEYVNLFMNSLSQDNIYLAIARPYFWNIATSSDSSTQIPYSTTKSTLEDWEDTLSLKRIFGSNMSAGVFRENWAANTKYDIYRHDWDGSIPSVYNGTNPIDGQPNSLNYAKWYVVTAQKDIYICLKQPKVAGVVQPSLYSPDTGVAIGTTGCVKTVDGYVWKLVARTSPDDQATFMTNQYAPIKTLAVAPTLGDHYYNQWTAQQTSANFKGGIYNIEILTGGTGYNGGLSGTRNVTDAETDAEFKVIGNGTGMQFTVTYASGVITDIEVTNPGVGYTYAAVQASGGTGATFLPIITPASGLGVNPASDLIATELIVGLELNSDEGGDFTVLNEYRKILLIKNPTEYGSTTVLTAATASAMTTLQLTGVTSTFDEDSVVTAPNLAKGRVVDWNQATNDVRVIRTWNENAASIGANNEFLAGQVVTSTSGGTGTIGAIVLPEVQKYSGTVIYSEYRRPITRSEGQTENIKIVLSM